MTSAPAAAGIRADGGDILTMIAIEITHRRACEYRSVSARNMLLLPKTAVPTLRKMVMNVSRDETRMLGSLSLAMVIADVAFVQEDAKGGKCLSAPLA